MPEYDLLVIGSGPAGQKAAIAASKRRKNVAVIDRIGMIGRVSATAPGLEVVAGFLSKWKSLDRTP